MQRRKFSLLSSFAVALIAVGLVGCAPESSDPAPSGTTDESDAPDTGTTQPDSSNEDGATSDPVAAEGGSTPASGQGEAIFTYGDIPYTSALSFCSLSEGSDALFHGVAVDDSGNEVGYLNGDFTILDGNAYGEVRIDFGATGQFESSDEIIAMGDAASNIVISAFSSTTWIVVGGAWTQENSDTTQSMLEVNC